MKNEIRYMRFYISNWLLIATLVGFGGGVAAVGLQTLIIFINEISGNIPLWLAPAIGGILVSVIYIWDKLASYYGTNHYIKAVNKTPDLLSFKTCFSKLLATAITLGFHGSGGVTGPMLVIGGSFASGISKIPLFKGKLSEEDYRRLIICGAAGAIGAIFRSPIGGGILVVEILYLSSLHYADLFPAMLSSVMGYVSFSMLSHGRPLFIIPNFQSSGYHIALFILSAILASLTSLFFISVFRKSQSIFGKIPYKKFHPVLGGILTGMVLLAAPKAAGIGSNMIQDMIVTKYPIQILLILLFGKILATSFTVSSGGSAGLVIPSLFIGAISGNIFLTILPEQEVGLAAALVTAGMAASLACVVNVPISAAVILMEVVGHNVGVPATIGSVIGFIIGHSKVIYQETSPDYSDFLRNKKFRESNMN
ncbi:chloride channel protein [Mobilitalea sibirica]|uniref:Chloride channel protein n=1 Tax=Mobilitalea sibirica TaxID=1462919 RepID=A0A8J7H0J1_9FIRM|nr:chloride channel protein [Mobilitalea sibirica]MBH1939659.1 chloride channel protein [Mobilitalea sibirica]